MPRNPVPPLVFLAVVLSMLGAWWLFQKTEAGRYTATRQVLQSRSEIRLGMTVRHASGPISEEDYRMADLDGLSSAEYRAVGRNGVVVKVDSLPHETFDVSFFFDKVVVDGIWELQSKPPRGDASTSYAIEISQLTDNQHGSHRFEFTDPHYWATTGGHQFRIHLDRNKPVPDLLRMSSTTLIEPRYQKLVDDFAGFGSAAFRARIADAQAKLRPRT